MSTLLSIVCLMWLSVLTTLFLQQKAETKSQIYIASYSLAYDVRQLEAKIKSMEDQ